MIKNKFDHLKYIQIFELSVSPMFETFTYPHEMILTLFNWNRRNGIVISHLF